ncbi:MAG: NIPSNAP family protein [Verrucomicrobia bacterium]|nr:NIPSNAP family protein [Verrucomicrobiota bacterium]MDA1069283.1 NIPSNAP family protein [Verrucomicrobiota bacterium]
MNIPRRNFLKTTLAASATTAVASQISAAGSTGTSREYYELRCYHLKADTRLKTDANPALLDAYLQQALLPALRKIGVENTGVFTELEVDKNAGTSTPKPGSPVWVLMTHRSLETYVQVSAALNADPSIQQAGTDYLQVPKSTPAFERIDSWLLLAFAGMPQLEVPAFSRDRIATRVLEMRDYESHSELKALNKMAMFNDGEISLMKDLGMSPVFFGQALSGPNLPHLRYITSGPDLATHLANWKKFGPAPRWQELKSNPFYKDNTSRNTARFLTPKPYSIL